MTEENVSVCYKNKYKSTTNTEHNKSVYAKELEQDFYVQLPNSSVGTRYNLHMDFRRLAIFGDGNRPILS